MDETMDGKKTDMQPVITLSHLTKEYKTYRRGSGFTESIKSFFRRESVVVTAVRDVSFTVRKGSVTGILGPNGAGKSTLIKMMTGTLFPTSGTIDVMGYTPAKNRKAYVQHIGAVFGQKSQLIWDIPPEDSFFMNAAIYGVDDADYRERLSLMVDLFELGDCIKKPTRVLSLGERMKCEFIMAMLHNPPVVFLDEPTIGLDVLAKQRIRSFIKKMNALGTTFILTTHDLEDVEQLAQDVIIINKGMKVFDGTLGGLSRTLGEKKIITLTLASRAGKELFSGLKGITSITSTSGFEMTIEADTAAVSMPQLLKELSARCSFTDISVKPLPMEQIITSIYTDSPDFNISPADYEK
jgi:ABC-2 type transport system ATP-binding protein